MKNVNFTISHNVVSIKNKTVKNVTIAFAEQSLDQCELRRLMWNYNLQIRIAFNWYNIQEGWSRRTDMIK